MCRRAGGEPCIAMCVALRYAQRSCSHAIPGAHTKLCCKSRMANINENTVCCVFSCMNNDCVHVSIQLLLILSTTRHTSALCAPLPAAGKSGEGSLHKVWVWARGDSGDVCRILWWDHGNLTEIIYTSHLTLPNSSKIPFPNLIFLAGAGAAYKLNGH